MYFRLRFSDDSAWGFLRFQLGFFDIRIQCTPVWGFLRLQFGTFWCLSLRFFEVSVWGFFKARAWGFLVLQLGFFEGVFSFGLFDTSVWGSLGLQLGFFHSSAWGSLTFPLVLTFWLCEESFDLYQLFVIIFEYVRTYVRMTGLI